MGSIFRKWSVAAGVAMLAEEIDDPATEVAVGLLERQFGFGLRAARLGREQ